jgi:hypothetical protein
MLPQKFSAATTCTTSDVLVEALAQPASPIVARVMAAAARGTATRFALIIVTVIISDKVRKDPPGGSNDPSQPPKSRE